LLQRGESFQRQVRPSESSTVNEVYPDETARVRERYRSERDGVQDREARRRGADTECECHHHDESEARTPSQLPRGNTEILEKGAHAVCRVSNQRTTFAPATFQQLSVQVAFRMTGAGIWCPAPNSLDGQGRPADLPSGIMELAPLALMVAAPVASLVLLRRRPVGAVGQRVQSDGSRDG
jgi:hypothetical protein